MSSIERAVLSYLKQKIAILTRGNNGGKNSQAKKVGRWGLRSWSQEVRGKGENRVELFELHLGSARKGNKLSGIVKILY